MRHLTVGEMAKLNHISEQTLRLYDKRGLLSPSFRGQNGYRYYDIKQSAVLDIIQYMKSLGISLKEIKHQLENRDLGRIEAALREKQRQTEEEIRLLKCQRRALERTVESFARWRAAPPDGTVQMEYIGARQMYVVDSGVNVYAHDVETYEEMLRDLKDGLVKDGLPQIYFCNAGTRMAQSDFEQGRLFASEVFVFVDREFVPEQLTATVPAGNYAPIFTKAGAACAGIICANRLQISPWPSQTPAGCTFGFRCPCSFARAARGGKPLCTGPKEIVKFLSNWPT